MSREHTTARKTSIHGVDLPEAESCCTITQAGAGASGRLNVHGIASGLLAPAGYRCQVSDFRAQLRGAPEVVVEIPEYRDATLAR
jgi:hypothetical protein